MKKGFSTVEVLLTILVGSIFIIASYGLYSSILKANLNSTARSKASNIAYNHLREITHKYRSLNCAILPQNYTETAQPGEELSNLEIVSTVSAPYGCQFGLYKFTVTVNYTVSGQAKTEEQSLYVRV